MSYPRKIFVLYLLKLLVFLKKNINSDHLVFVTFLRLYVWKFATWKKKHFWSLKFSVYVEHCCKIPLVIMSKFKQNQI